MMAEIKLRHELVVRTLFGIHEMPELAQYEFCYLQFRMICELIALGCLAVHGEVPGTASSRLTDAHQADFILNALEKLHPKFYPEPGIKLSLQSGEAFHEIENPLPKQDLLKLYWKCGEILHRGSFRRISTPPKARMEEVEPICRKLADLLKFHRIALLGTEDELWLEMGHGTKIRGSLRRPAHLAIKWQPSEEH